jgi:DNA-binding transcriptional ArsR family regulator
MDSVFRALGDPTRREILRRLRRRDMSAGELAGCFPLAKSTLSAHLNVLKGAGLVVYERHGTSLVYSLNESVFEAAFAAVLELFSGDGRRAAQARRSKAPRAEGSR